jgi:hypothetical protein
LNQRQAASLQFLRGLGGWGRASRQCAGRRLQAGRPHARQGRPGAGAQVGAPVLSGGDERGIEMNDLSEGEAAEAVQRRARSFQLWSLLWRSKGLGRAQGPASFSGLVYASPHPAFGRACTQVQHQLTSFDVFYYILLNAHPGNSTLNPNSSIVSKYIRIQVLQGPAGQGEGRGDGGGHRQAAPQGARRLLRQPGQEGRRGPNIPETLDCVGTCRLGRPIRVMSVLSETVGTVDAED